MERTAVQSLQFQSKTNPKVKVVLEFTGEADNGTIETEITNVLLGRYLKKVLKEPVQSGTRAFTCSPRGEKTYE